MRRANTQSVIHIWRRAQNIRRLRAKGWSKVAIRQVLKITAEEYRTALANFG